MAAFKTREEYFETIAHNNKLIAHNRDLDDGLGIRKSFSSINDEEELQSAVANKAHFPFVVNIGHSIKFLDGGSGLPLPKVGNHLYFLTKLDLNEYPTEAEARQAAFDITLTAVYEFLSYILEDNEENAIGGEMFVLDFSSISADMIGPIDQKLFGWYLRFMDKKTSNVLKFDNTKWFETP